MSKIDRINELLLEELSEAVNKEVGIEGALITISDVKCDPDLKKAVVRFSILPDNLAGSALRKLKSSTSQLVGILKKRVKLRKIPHLIWEFDATEREAEKIEKLINETIED
ncbi:MAG: ribosome-binding factor A [Patescibacteria group bacterium]|jgi:ribosome-binding factor A|nr:ribosome-binding factor A [Patescibacteria group bacterium]